MPEYIEREALLKVLRGSAVAKYPASFAMGLFAAADEVSNLPTAEVAPVVHGRWEPIMEGVWNLPTPICVGWSCSLCGRYEQYKEPYCNCGARMDGE